MVFHYPQYPTRNIPKLNLKINNSDISQVHTFNFLGLTLTDTMSWKEHCHKIATKISKCIGIMSKMKRFLNQSTLLKIYNTLIHSHFHYAILCWGFQNNRLKTLQKKAIRIISNSRYNAHTDPLFKRLQILKLDDIFKIQCIKFYYKYEHDMLPGYFSQFFTRNTQIHTHRTRQQGSLHLFPFKKSNTRNTIRHHIPTLINSLPQNIRSKIHTHSLPTIKRTSKKYYLEQYPEHCQIPNCYTCNYRAQSHRISP